MNAWEALARTPQIDLDTVEAETPAPFEIAGPTSASALVFASPHSGRIYPTGMMSASRLDADAIRRSEDVWVDRLIEAAPVFGVSVITARLARVYLDVNREPWELDPAMFSDELPAYARAHSARVAAGLGAIARIVSEGEEVYARKLTFAEARQRVEAVHAPYHAWPPTASLSCSTGIPCPRRRRATRPAGPATWSWATASAAPARRPSRASSSAD
jgi:hypothetical protein